MVCSMTTEELNVIARGFRLARQFAADGMGMSTQRYTPTRKDKDEAAAQVRGIEKAARVVAAELTIANPGEFGAVERARFLAECGVES